MSSLLEEAIVDAKALREAALKNAEDAVLEKYSGEVKRALDTLLEQDEMGLEEEADGEDLMEFTEEVPYAFANEEIGGPVEEEIVEIDFDALKERLAEEDTAVEGTDLIDATALADTLEESSMEVDPSVQTATLSDPADAADEREDEEESATAATRAAPSPMSLEED